jgi:hypothetical protein
LILKEIEVAYERRPSGLVEVTGPGGDTPLGPKRPAQEIMKEKERSSISTFVSTLDTLSKKLITKVGPTQKTYALSRAAKGNLNNDADFIMYQDTRKALAGSLATFIQGSRPSDMDIKSVYLPMIPDIFRDNPESAQGKWSLIKTMSGLNTQGAAGEITVNPDDWEF